MSVFGCARPVPISKLLSHNLGATPQIAQSQAIILTSDTIIEFKVNEDAVAKVIVLKAPIVKISSLLSATKLVIIADVLDLDGAYITKPKNWDLQVGGLRARNMGENSQWILTLKQNQNGIDCIYNANFDSKYDPECSVVDTDKNIDLAAKIKGLGKLITKEIKDFFPHFKNKV